MSTKTFTAYFVLLFALIVLFGFIVPALVSAHDDLSVAIGVLICVVFIYIVSICGIHIYKSHQPTNKGTK